MRTQKFFVCKHCGNMVGMIKDAGVPMICCGEPMAELVPNTVDAAQEKHVPEVTVQGNLVTVKIGSVPHPMLPEHHIEWIYLETEQGGHRRILSVPSEAVATFSLVDGEKPITAFEYCNLHGLWKKDL